MRGSIGGVRDGSDRARDSFRLADLDPDLVEQLEEVDVAGIAPVETHDLEASVRWLGLTRDDERLVLGTFPRAGGDRDQDRRWVLDRMRKVLNDDMPSGDPSIRLQRFGNCGVAGELFPLHVLLTVVPEVVRFH